MKATCPECGNKVSVSAGFCDSCGAALRADDRAGSAREAKADAEKRAADE